MPPVTQKLIAGVAIFLVILGGLGAGIYAKTNENAEIAAEIEKIQAEIQGFDAIIATREEKRKQREAQDDNFKELVAILPQYSERQEERVLESITSYASVAKLKYKGLVPVTVVAPTKGAAAPQGPPRPGQPKSADFSQTQLTVRFEGTFFNLLKFLDMIEKHDSFLAVESIQLSPMGAKEGPQPEHKELSITVKISTYHYVAK
jgi:hypothetical protein